MRRAGIGSVAALAGSLLPAVAWAQVGGLALNQNIDVQAFRPAPGGGNLLTVEGSGVDGHLTAFAGAWLNYANRPITVFHANCPSATNDAGCRLGAPLAHPVVNLVTLNLQAGFTLFRRLQLSIDLPVSVESGDQLDPTTAAPISDAGGPRTQTNGGLGDPRLEAKLRLAGDPLRGPGLAVAAFGTLPLGRNAGGADHYLGDASATLGGRVIADFRAGPVFIAANIGALWRPDNIQLLSTSVGSLLLWGAGMGYQFSPRLGAIGEVFGTSDAGASFTRNTAEGDLALRYTLRDVAITAGGGAGLQRGIGAPVGRAFLGVVYAPYRVDTDHDGVMDNVDRCPNEPEDRDGFEDADGCPDPDNDGDGIPDTADRCPDAAEDRDGFEDTDGCPDPDNDHDGIPDGFDACPNQPEDRDGDRDEDGCPDNDRDRDGIPDDVDRCPTEPEDTDGFEDTDGCPDPDNDHDGIPDNLDQCSEEPETINGFQDDDGCPDSLPDRDHDGIPDNVDRCPDQPETYNGVADTDGCPERAQPVLADLQGGQIQILRAVNFASRRDRIVGGESFRVLDSVTAILRAHPELQAVEVQGHTDDQGGADANRLLSQRRAEAVRQYLLDHGIAAPRVRAQGYGSDRPIESNRTAAGRAHNRRVEFHIVPLAAPAEAASPGAPAPATATPTGAAPAAIATPAAAPSATAPHPAP